MLARDPIIMNQQIPISPVETRTTKSLDDRQEHIRRRAFEIYEQRGRQDGLDLEDWLQAEREVVTASHSRAVRSAMEDWLKAEWESYAGSLQSQQKRLRELEVTPG